MEGSRPVFYAGQVVHKLVAKSEAEQTWNAGWASNSN
jgi:hypothetical protein